VSAGSDPSGVRQGGAPPPPGPARVYLTMTGVRPYYDAAVAAGARVAVPLAAREYGMCDCRLLDLDGNELSFGESSG